MAKLADDRRKLDAYDDGRQAFIDGKEVYEGDVLPKEDRIAWLTGWYGQRVQQSVGRILKRYGQRWP